SSPPASRRLRFLPRVLAPPPAVFLINIAESFFRHPPPRRSAPDPPYNQPGTQPPDHPVGPATEHSHSWSVGSPPFSQRTSRVSRGSSGPTRRGRSGGCSRTGAGGERRRSRGTEGSASLPPDRG